ncbi:MAG TPA: porin, partial [Persephonella sp.]|nr:porin [Persephonella sp.]
MKKLLASALLGAGAIALLNAPSANAAPTFYFGDGKKLTIFQMVQVWNVYTIDTGKDGYDSRNDVYIRRGRIGVKGKLRKDIS